MLTKHQFDLRCASLYRGMQSRYRPRYWKSGRRQGQLREPGREIPFDVSDLGQFLGGRIGLNAKPCPYCGTAIDILTLSLDHKIPSSRGGSLGLENLTECCADCNRLKASLTEAEFEALLAFSNALAPAAQTDLRQRRKAGAMGIRQRFIKGRGDDAGGQPRAPRYRAPQMELQQDF